MRPTCWSFPWVDASKAIVRKPTAAFPDLVLSFSAYTSAISNYWFFLKHCIVYDPKLYQSCTFFLLLRASLNPLLISLDFLFLTVSQSLPNFLSIPLVISSSHLILWCPLFLLPSIFPSIRDFSNELAVHIRWPKYWSFSSASVLPMNIQDWLLPWWLSG